MTTLVASSGETAFAVYVAPFTPGATIARERACRPHVAEPPRAPWAARHAPQSRCGSEPRVELPDRRPLTRAQRVVVPPELLALWRAARSPESTR